MTFVELIEPINQYLKTNHVAPLTDGEVHYWLNQYKGLENLEQSAVVESIIARRQGRIANTPLPLDGSIAQNSFSNFTFKWGLGVDLDV